MNETPSLGSVFLETATRNFRGLKTLAENALAQLTDDELHYRPDPESNSVALLLQHVSGNLISRWTDFLTTDGEKPDRRRDDEFVDLSATRQGLLEQWERGWSRLLETLGSLSEHDLLAIVTIRGEPHTVILAINRQIVHHAYHVGQIVYLAKMIRSSEWKNLSIPKREALGPRPKGKRPTADNKRTLETRRKGSPRSFRTLLTPIPLGLGPRA